MPRKVNLPTNRNFGIVFSIVFLIIALWPLLITGDAVRYWSLFVSFIFLVLGLTNSKFLTPLNKIWFKFGMLLGNVFAPIVMSIVYFLVITPIGFLMRLIGKDILSLKKNNKSTYWIAKEKNNISMRKQF